jgi:hypothetical protein
VSKEDDEEEGEYLGELRERVKASTIGEDSTGEDEGPKMRRSLSAEGVSGREISLSSGSGASTDGGGGLFLGLRYGSRGSFSIWVSQDTTLGAAGKPGTKFRNRN